MSGSPRFASAPRTGCFALARSAAAIVACVALAGCEQVMRDMYEQPRFDPDEATQLFDNGSATRAPPAGSVARSRGDVAATTSGRRGVEAVEAAQAAYARKKLPPITAALLARGQQRFDIYCAPCHGIVGDGDGPVVRHGFPAPPSYHVDRLREAPDRHFFDVVTNGHGIMYSYADRVTPQDRWAIVAWIRTLQLSQHAQVDSLPARLRARLEAAR
ncbi:MAG: cytochrome c [Burkholderiaceae bacterium]|nr:cytochrome c [Burkholderiaceae bacterium]